MMKLLKIVIAIVVVLAGALVAAGLLIDPNDYKDQITAKVNEATGRTLTIGGDIGLSLFPWIAVELNDVALSNAEGFGDEPFTRINRAEVRLKLLPLLSREVEAGTIVLQGLVLNLARDAGGRSNWDDLAGEPAASPSLQKPSEPAARKDAPALSALAIGGVDIRDGQVSWRDEGAGQQVDLSDIRLQTGAIVPGVPVDVELGFTMASEAPAMQVRTDLSGEVDLATSLRQIAVNGLQLAVEASGSGVPVPDPTINLGADVSVDLDADSASLKGLTLSAYELDLSGNFDVTGMTTDAEVKGRVKVEEFNARDLLAALEQPVPETADPKALTRVALDSAINATASSLGLIAMDLQLDETRVNGNFRIKDFATSALTFKLDLDEIDLDRYLPPPAEGETAPVASPAEAAAGAATLPVETLRALHIFGTATIGKIKVSGLHAADIALKVNARDGLLRTEQSVGKLYEGNYSGKLTINAREAVPKLSLNESLNDVRVGPLLVDATGKDIIDGRGNVTAALRTQGSEIEAWKKGLNGNASIAFTDGAVKGINIAGLLRDAQASVLGGGGDPVDEPEQTDFSELTASMRFVNGVMHNKDFSAKSPLLRVTGEGKVNLVNEKINYTATPKIVGSLEGQGGKGLDKLKGVAIPVHINGTFAEPRFEVDVKSMLTESQKEKVDKKVDKYRDKLEDKVGDKLKKLF